MMSKPISVATRSKYYRTPTLTGGKKKEATPSSSAPSFGPLHIECPNLDSAIWPPSRCVLRKSLYNPNSQAAQHYNIVEDLAQASSTMLALEVLRSYSLQQKSLLSAIGVLILPIPI